MIKHVAPRGKYRADGASEKGLTRLSSGLALPASLPIRHEARFRDRRGAMPGPHHTARGGARDQRERQR